MGKTDHATSDSLHDGTLVWSDILGLSMNQGQGLHAANLGLVCQGGQVSAHGGTPEARLENLVTIDNQQRPPGLTSIEGRVELDERTETPGRTHADNKATPRHWAGKEDFEQNKTIISELYKSKGLKAMMKIMEEEHAFKATPKMFKKRVSDWGLEKNIKSQEMEAIVRKQVQRSSVGKESIFVLRGMQVPQYKIERFRKASKSRPDDYLLKLAVGTPPDLTCHTPLPPPVALDRELEIPEQIAKAVQDYVCGLFEAGVWTVSEGQSSIHEKAQQSCAINFENDSSHASRLLSTGDREGWRLLNVALASGHRMIEDDAIHTLQVLATVTLQKLLQHNVNDITFFLLKQFSIMSTQKKPPAHPLRRIFDCLLALDTSKLKTALCTAVHSQEDCLSQKSGRFSWSVIYLHLERIDVLHTASPDNLIQEYESWISECELAFGPRDVRCLYVRARLADIYRNQGRCREAAEICQTGIDLMRKNEPSRDVLYVLSRVYVSLSLNQHDLSESDMALRNVGKAIEISVELNSWEDSRVLDRISILRKWLKEMGRWEEADEWGVKEASILQEKCDRIEKEERERWTEYQGSNNHE